MIDAYTTRLICLSLAVFFLVHLAAGCAVWALAKRAALVCRKLRPRWAERTMAALRWAPLGLATFAVVAICVPSYLRLEPGDAAEQLGVVCVVAAVLGVGVVMAAMARGMSLVSHSQHQVREFEHTERPVVAIAGILRPRLLVSRTVKAALTEEQMEAALRHEEAHGVARDNLKRLLMAFTPGLLPWFSGFTAVEREWSRFAEWAADDDAVDGDPNRALTLASALVQVARLCPAPTPLASSLLDGEGLVERVERLLHPAGAQGGARVLTTLFLALALLMVGLAAAALHPASLEFAHEALEHLMG